MTFSRLLAGLLLPAAALAVSITTAAAEPRTALIVGTTRPIRGDRCATR